MDHGGPVIVTDDTHLQRRAARDGPMNIVTSASSVWKARQ